MHRHAGTRHAIRHGSVAALVSIAALVALGAAARARAQECTGDCGNDNTVTIEEVITMVGIGLGITDEQECPLGDANGDGEITVDEIVKAVGLTLRSLSFEAHGTCTVPGRTAADPVDFCRVGTPVRAYRCIDRNGCVANPSARHLLGETTVTGENGVFEFTQIADCYGGTSTFLFEGEPVPETPEERYRVLDFGVVSATRRSATGITVDNVQLSAVTEATVRLVDSNGAENFGEETFGEVLAAVTKANPPESLIGQTPGDAANAATTTASEDAEVQAVIATVLRHDVPVSTSIDPLGNVDLYKLTLHERTPIVLQMTRSSGTITPCLEVRVAGGTQPVPNGRVCAAPAARLDLLLDAGTYYVYAEDEGGDGIGSYDLEYLRLTATDAEPLAGDPISAAIGPVGDIDPYTFKLTTCAVVTLRATRATGTFSPCLELRQEGANAPLEGGAACADHAQETINVRLDAGRYVVLVGDAGNDDVGSYTLQLLVAPGCATPTPTPTPTPTQAAAASWEAAADYSASRNPNGAWSYGRKWTPHGLGFDLMPVPWGACGWYFGNVGHGGPSIQCGPVLWAKNNSNGYPVIRWTAPQAGDYRISGAFSGADGRGVDTLVYVAINGSTVFADHVAGVSDTKAFNVEGVYLAGGTPVDFVVAWAGGVYSEYNWTRLSAVISATGATAPTPSPTPTATPSAAPTAPPPSPTVAGFSCTPGGCNGTCIDDACVPRAHDLFFSIADPQGDHTGLVDVKHLVFSFGTATGDYLVTLTAYPSAPFLGDIRINLNLYDPDTGTTACVQSMFHDTVNDYHLATPLMGLTLSGTAPSLRYWAAGNRVATSTLAGLGNPPCASYFGSAVQDLPVQATGVADDTIGAEQGAIAVIQPVPTR